MNFNLQENFLNEEALEKKTMRDGIGEGLRELGERHDDVVVLGADTKTSTRANLFEESFPERFVQCGVAEQNLIGETAGFAYQGKKPYAITYSVFLVGRAWEPIRTTICYPNNNAVLIGSHSGLATGPDGPTHQMTEDISIMRCLPNMTVVAPADLNQAKRAVIDSYDIDGPVYIRAVREHTPVFTTEDTPFEVGKAQVLKKGDDITFVGHGHTVYSLLKASSILEEELSAEVINIHTIKPIDVEAIVASAKKTGKVFVAEDHNVIGGLGSAVSEVIAKEGITATVYTHGVKDTFTQSANADELLKIYKLDTHGILETTKNFYNI